MRLRHPVDVSHVEERYQRNERVVERESKREICRREIKKEKEIKSHIERYQRNERVVERERNISISRLHISISRLTISLFIFLISLLHMAQNSFYFPSTHFSLVVERESKKEIGRREIEKDKEIKRDRSDIICAISFSDMLPHPRQKIHMVQAGAKRECKITEERKKLTSDDDEFNYFFCRNVLRLASMIYMSV